MAEKMFAVNASWLGHTYLNCSHYASELMFMIR